MNIWQTLSLLLAPPSRSARQAEAEASNGVKGFCATSMAKMIATILYLSRFVAGQQYNQLHKLYETMMKQLYLALVVIFFAAVLPQSTVASDSASSTTGSSKGFNLIKRERKTIKIDDLHIQVSDHDTNLRQWNEDEYESIMNGISGGQGNLRHRNMRNMQQQQNGNNQSEQYYLPEQSRMSNWQIIALVVSVTGTVFFAYYAYTLRHELSTLNQYLPLGYKLFPDHDASEECDRPVGGVEMS